MSAGNLVKPLLRGYHTRQVKRDLGIAITGGIIAGIAYHYLRVVPLKKKYIEFYRTYDPEEHFESMRQKGWLQSARPDGEED